MEPPLSVLDKLETAYDIVADVLGEAPQLYDIHLDQALLVLVLAMKRARRSPKLHRRAHYLRPLYQDQNLPF
jgi:hypothetical protein